MRNLNGQRNRWIVPALAVIGAIAVGSPALYAQGVAPPLGGSVTTHYMIGSGWEIDDGAGGPVKVIRDPNGSPWAKDLQGPSGGPFIAVPGDLFSVSEFLVIDGPLDWADWHEEILSPDWEWVVNAANPADFLANGAPAPGLTVSALGSTIDFDFDPLPPGTLIEIQKTLQYVGDPGATPEPATLGMAAMGGVALLRRRRPRC
jgi:MYXO-CTERM domain-containing protein